LCPPTGRVVRSACDHRVCDQLAGRARWSRRLRHEHGDGNDVSAVGDERLVRAEELFGCVGVAARRHDRDQDALLDIATFCSERVRARVFPRLSPLILTGHAGLHGLGSGCVVLGHRIVATPLERAVLVGESRVGGFQPRIANRACGGVFDRLETRRTDVAIAVGGRTLAQSSMHGATQAVPALGHEEAAAC
jgi:hypothetical protein